MFKLIAAAALSVGLMLGTPAAAQGLFSPVIEVNGDPITRFELEQRALMLAALRAPGDPATEARTQLIDDRLKMQIVRGAGFVPSEDQVLQGMDEFASRASLTREEFLAALAQEGVEPETFRDFVEVGIAWREYVGQRFGPRTQVTDEEIDRALSRASGSTGLRVLLSEIIIPIPPGQEDDVRALAREISEMTTEAAFADAARRYSATATREDGGRLPWQTLSELPPPLRPIILQLAPGDVSEPLNLTDAVALFQLRAMQELPYAPPEYGAIEYAAYYLPGGRSPETLAEAAEIMARVDKCDDLYGVAYGQPAERLDRQTLPPGDLPDDIAFELAKLDDGEVSTALTRNNGQTLVFLMLCGRSLALDLAEELPAAPADTVESQDVELDPDAEVPPPDPVAEARQQVALGLRNRRLETLAEGFLSQLRADARIVEP